MLSIMNEKLKAAETEKKINGQDTYTLKTSDEVLEYTITMKDVDTQGLEIGYIIDPIPDGLTLVAKDGTELPANPTQQQLRDAGYSM